MVAGNLLEEANPSLAVELVDALTPDVVLRAITPPQPGWDIASITTPVTAARVATDDLVFERGPALRVPTIAFDGARWVVGPIDASGVRQAPPISLAWQQAWGDLRLTIDAAWSLWGIPASAELTGLRAAERALDAAGFTVEL